MAVFTANMSGIADLADHLVVSFEHTFLLEKENLAKGIDSLATMRFARKAASISFPKYSALTRQTSALTAEEDTTSEAMVDTAITIATYEFGNGVTTTELVQAQSDGLPNVAAVELVGINMRDSMEALMLTVGEAGSNETIVTQAAEASLTASDIITGNYVKRMHNRLSRVGAPGPYYGIIHDDVKYDLVVETAETGWTRTNQYADPDSILANEVGMFGGFRIIAHPVVTVNADAGNAAVDTYHCQFFGKNAFGKAIAVEPGLRLTGPFDKLGRFYNFGWYGIYNYGLIDTDYHQLLTCASSIGSNT